MKAASIDGHYDLAACPMFNIEMAYCDVDYWQIKCLLPCLLTVTLLTLRRVICRRTAVES